VIEKGLKVVILFEGRDGAGKGGTIKAITGRVSPRIFRVVALPAPTEREKTQMYVQRYLPHMPAAGEVVIFDRSWYNRAGVERVMGFASDEQVQGFLKLAPLFEKLVVGKANNIILLKYWLEVDMDEQTRRLEARITDPRKQWKLSPMDLKSYSRWYDYSHARDEMFKATDTEWAPWFVARSDDKKRVRLNIIKHILSSIPYEVVKQPKIILPKRQKPGDYKEINLPLKYVPGMTSLPRHNGILLHPTSLPGPHGSGDLGPAAYHFVDWLVGAGQSLWQVLPLGSVGPGNSPYISPSAFAGNELLIDLGQLRDAGWLSDADLAVGTGVPRRPGRLRRRCGASVCPLATGRQTLFRARSLPANAAFEAFCTDAHAWLDDYALFMALDIAHGGDGRMWQDWPAPLAHAQADALREAQAGTPTRSTSGSSASGVSTSNGRRSSATPTRAASRSSATCRSSSPRTAPMCGPIPDCSTSTCRVVRASSPACPRTTSAPPGSAGATRSTAGRRMPPKTTAGGSSGCGRR
jgi:polyphosphate kinase 2